MPVKRNLWEQSYQVAAHYPCPRCSEGVVIPLKETESVKEPAWSEDFFTDPDWDPDWVTKRFVELLKCNKPKCGEFVAVSGETFALHAYDEEEGNVFFEMKRPRSMFPAPPLFPLSASIPDNIKDQIKLAFQLYWSDLSACASRLRASLELVLDEQKVAKKKKTKKGDFVFLNLSDRIKAYELSAGDTDGAESMNALRVIGNLGTHENSVSTEALFDALDVYEDALLEIYEQKTLKLKAKKAKLISKKGKY